MVHGALLGVAITATVVAATAFEVGVFRPWREENWPEGLGEEIRREWHSVKEDVRQVLGGRDAWSARADARRRRRSSSAGSSGSSTAHEDEELRREVEEFELHEREVLRMRERMLREFGTSQQEQEEIAASSALQHRGSDARQRHQAKISEHHARQAANLAASRARREKQNLLQQQLQQQQQQSGPVNIAPRASSRQSSVLFDRPTHDEPDSPHHALGDDASSVHSDASPLLPQDATPPALPPKPNAYATSPLAGSSYATALAPSSYATAATSATVVPGRRRLSSSASSTHSHASDTSNLNMDRSRHSAVINDIFTSFDELREERLAGSIGTLRSSASVRNDDGEQASTPRSSRAPSPSPRTSPLPHSASLSTHDPLLGLRSPPFDALDDEEDMHIISPPGSVSGWTDARSASSHTLDEGTGTYMSRAPSSSASSTSAFSYAVPPSASSLGVRSSDAASSHAPSEDGAFEDLAASVSINNDTRDPFEDSTLFSSAETQGQWRMPSVAMQHAVATEEARSSDEEWDRISDANSEFASPRTAIRSLRDEA